MEAASRCIRAALDAGITCFDSADSYANGVAEARGITSLIDVPGRGRFILALYSGGNSAFIRAGTVRRNVIEFEWAGETFRVECAGPVSPTGDRPVFAMLQTGAKVQAFSFGSGGAPNQYRSAGR